MGWVTLGQGRQWRSGQRPSAVSFRVRDMNDKKRKRSEREIRSEVKRRVIRER